MFREFQQSQEQILSTKNLNNKNSNSKIGPILPNTTDLFLEQILQTVSELEHSIIANHQQDYNLRMALEKQTERVQDLHACLNNEKQRNQRLVDLILNIDSCPSEEDECGDYKLSGRNVINRWSLSSTNDTYESISPLLMQQRYEELSSSYKQCRKQLLKKDNLLKVYKCEKELLQSQYEHLMEEYRQAQKRFEEICARYLSLQKKKNYEIQHLQESLTCASDCIITAQQILDTTEEGSSKHFEFYSWEFQQNLQLFVKTLQHSEWTQCKCCCINSNRIK